ncbi:hypothetical protein D4T97_001115 [Siminovitchia acidinfaciens]|uniref:Uncharacterized protein n=1 Tax=Siminovitchia acidinfaciens TaxID=2321395 RepID=A0A429Y6Q2_9BACI|nr:hypothetical protein D4T97_001115 [Siminovitchia acidinfaciens]
MRFAKSSRQRIMYGCSEAKIFTSMLYFLPLSTSENISLCSKLTSLDVSNWEIGIPISMLFDRSGFVSCQIILWFLFRMMTSSTKLLIREPIAGASKAIPPICYLYIPNISCVDIFLNSLHAKTLCML